MAPGWVLPVAVLVAAPALAGCLALPDTPARPLDLATDAETCREVLLLVLVDPDHARRFLPSGFEPADAAAFFGSPIPAGRALVSVNAIRCEASALEDGPAAFADLIVVVEPPRVEGASVEDATRSAYSVREYVSGPGLVEATAGTGYAVRRIGIDVAFGPGPDGAASTGTGVLADEHGELARLEVHAVPGASDTATANLFQVTPTGLVVHGFAWRDGPLSVGGATCTLRPGSLVADVLGAERCDEADVAGALFGPVDVRARLRYFPGAGVVG